MSANASSRLTAAMMPSSRLVVPSSAGMSASEWRRLAAWISVGRLSRLADHIAQEAPTLAGHIRGPLDRSTKAVELADKILERGFELAAEGFAAIREEEEAGDSTER